MSASAVADEEGRKVFLGGLSYDANEKDLRNDFGKYGEMEDLQFPMDGGKHKVRCLSVDFACALRVNVNSGRGSPSSHTASRRTRRTR